jgi:hypothetical protein
MYFKSKTISLVILGATSLVVSRAMFAFINDPEGPNLLIVTVLAAVIYCVSVAGYAWYPSAKLAGLTRLLGAVVFQILLVAGLYLFLS